MLKKRPNIFQIIDRRRSEAGNEEILNEESECVAAARIGSDDQVEFPNAICYRIFENNVLNGLLFLFLVLLNWKKPAYNLSIN